MEKKSFELSVDDLEIKVSDEDLREELMALPSHPWESVDAKDVESLMQS
jgi:hypothetical protein